MKSANSNHVKVDKFSMMFNYSNTYHGVGVQFETVLQAKVKSLISG